MARCARCIRARTFLEFGAGDFAAELVHFVVGNRAEFALHVLGQFDAELAFEQIRHAAFAGLAIDADDFAVFAADVRGVNREIRHIPMLRAVFFPFVQPFLDGVLVRTAERGENQFARVRLARRTVMPVQRS